MLYKLHNFSPIFLYIMYNPRFIDTHYAWITDFVLLKCSFPAMTVPTNGMAIYCNSARILPYGEGAERFTWNPVNGSLSVEFLEENMARLFILTEN